ncbi:uncharacterized protein GLRG_03211 [Colletotrichum graminicola M1.001]|uniref:Uncharacterized protein n=1 Tax=Colletotrichum graminicola (strain M1.001 / M2 / FGSC 10212) TaxID=645133 RepID=E3QB29_COLGM|nr:uncharacterized protein GLRG_03211 [Colletotrichum graminicola M1.001]EFQ28067.1 hypothetical protein GLRG_03211 [Colletotrichum graminicola M1.001]
MAPTTIIGLIAWVVGIHPHLSAKVPATKSLGEPCLGQRSSWRPMKAVSEQREPEGQKLLSDCLAPARRAELYTPPPARMALIWVDAVSLGTLLAEGGRRDAGVREWVVVLLQVAKLH